MLEQLEEFRPTKCLDEILRIMNSKSLRVENQGIVTVHEEGNKRYRTSAIFVKSLDSSDKYVIVQKYEGDDFINYVHRYRDLVRSRLK